MKNVNGIQTLFEDAICPTPGGKGDRASSDPGVPVRDAPAATGSVVGPMTQTVSVEGENSPSKIKGS